MVGEKNFQDFEFDLRDLHYEMHNDSFMQNLNWHEASVSLHNWLADRQFEFEDRGSRYDDPGPPCY